MSENNIFNDSVLLTAEDLAKHASSSKVLPHGGGQKCYAPSGTWLEEKQLDALLQERLDMLTEERIVSRNDLSHGEWQPETCCVLLTKGRGKLFQHMGFHLNGKHLLYPVEALFLMESSVLQVTYNGVPLSIEQSYALFLTDGFDKFQVYSHLSRLGYIVTIYKKRDYVTPCKKKTTPDTYMKTQKKSEPDLREKTVEEELACEEIMILSSTQPQNSSAVVSSRERTETRPSKDVIQMSAKLDSKQSHHIPLSTSLSGEKYECDPDVSFPIFLPDQKILLNRPPQHLLPKNVTPSKSFYILRPEKFQKSDREKAVVESWRRNTACNQRRRHNDGRNHQRNSREGNSQSGHEKRDHYDPQRRNNEERNRPSSYGRRGRSQNNHPSSSKRRKQNEDHGSSSEDYPCAFPRVQLAVSNWKEFKSASAMSAKAGWPLFAKDVKPLVQTVLSTDDLHSEIKIVEEANFSLLMDEFSNSDNVSSHQMKLDFDVYLPNVPFKKSQPSPPNLRLSVINSQQAVPSLLEVARLQIDDVPLYFAVVDNGEINFYGFQPVTLCPVKPMS